ncbi:hypothetical protein K0B96_01250 [Horticoccus luteus]|uniref:Uncharacterized protein n=1 Tax=Horticoccus luteus TaxID=2862869 RepID=A0A8F9TVX0_9BACT|nr:hypothetical protein [Horticoccus luteus]QYM79273.1 hypothetical protein K0B96_01250 [Horticoccus luteus]
MLFYFITNMLLGGIVGAIAGGAANNGSDAQTFSEGFAQGKVAGREATVAFFQKHGLAVLAGQIVVFGTLCWFSVLPGVGRYKMAKNG